MAKPVRSLSNFNFNETSPAYRLIGHYQAKVRKLHYRLMV